MSQLAQLVLAPMLEMGLMGETLPFPLLLPSAAVLVGKNPVAATVAALVVVVEQILLVQHRLAALEQQDKALRVAMVSFALRAAMNLPAAVAELELSVQTLLPLLAAMAEQARLLLSLAAHCSTLAAAAEVQGKLQALQGWEAMAAAAMVRALELAQTAQQILAAAAVVLAAMDSQLAAVAARALLFYAGCLRLQALLWAQD